jgi:hypothetical protein
MAVTVTECPQCSGRLIAGEALGHALILCEACGYQEGYAALRGRGVFRYQDRYWQTVLAEEGLSVISSQQIKTVVFASPPWKHRVAVVYKRDEETGILHRHGSTVGLGYKRTTMRTPKKAPCMHLLLRDSRWRFPWSGEWTGLQWRLCPDCDKLQTARDVFSVHAVDIIRSHRQLWKDRRHTPMRVNPYACADDDSADFKALDAGFTNVKFTRQRLVMGVFGLRLLPRRPIAVSKSPAPEIDQRRREAAFRYELRNPPYRAPHRKVLELRDAGLEIDQIARKLKVSPSTIDNRLREVPETVSCPDLRALHIKAGGWIHRFGYIRVNSNEAKTPDW